MARSTRNIAFACVLASVFAIVASWSTATEGHLNTISTDGTTFTATTVSGYKSSEVTPYKNSGVWLYDSVSGNEIWTSASGFFYSTVASVGQQLVAATYERSTQDRSAVLWYWKSYTQGPEPTWQLTFGQSVGNFDERMFSIQVDTEGTTVVLTWISWDGDGYHDNILVAPLSDTVPTPSILKMPGYHSYSFFIKLSFDAQSLIWDQSVPTVARVNRFNLTDSFTFADSSAQLLAATQHLDYALTYDSQYGTVRLWKINIATSSAQEIWQHWPGTNQKPFGAVFLDQYNPAETDVRIVAAFYDNINGSTLHVYGFNLQNDTLEFSTSQPLTVFPNSGIYPLSTPVAQAYDAQAEVNMIFFGVTGSGIYAVCPERQTVQNVLTTPNNLCQPITIAVISAANGQVEALASVQTPDHDLNMCEDSYMTTFTATY